MYSSLKEQWNAVPSGVAIGVGLFDGFALALALPMLNLPFWKEFPLFLAGIVVLAFIWTPVFAIYDKWKTRRDLAKKIQDSWDKFIDKSNLIGAELELQNARGIFRSPILNIKRDGKAIVFERKWIASYQGQEKGWEHIEARDGLDFRFVPDGVAPSRRVVDEVYFLSTNTGYLKIYVLGHRGHLGLEHSNAITSKFDVAEQPS